MTRMKTTIDLPDDLVTEIKVEAARRRRTLKDLVPELLRTGLQAARAGRAPSADDSGSWVDAWVALGASTVAARPDGLTATQVLARDRDRL